VPSQSKITALYLPAMISEYHFEDATCRFAPPENKMLFITLIGSHSDAGTRRTLTPTL
jgi:hypothetical protein